MRADYSIVRETAKKARRREVRNEMGKGPQDYVILEAHMNATAKLLDAQQAINTALAASRQLAGMLEAAAMAAKREHRAQSNDPR